MIKEITSKDEFKKFVLDSKGDVLVDFNANWCGPCQMLKPILEELSNTYSIVSVNTDDNSDLALEYSIMSIPCLIKFSDGVEVKRSTGFKPKEEVIDFINN